jgi:hypothetical protein
VLRPKLTLLRAATDVLGILPTHLSEVAGVSKRTAQGWFTGRSNPMPGALEAIARRVHPIDRALASELAVTAGTTLLALGLESPPAAPAAPAPVAKEAPPSPPSDLMVDSVVCAAAEAIAVMPHAVRPALLAAFTRARLLGLSLEAVEGALKTPVPKA